MKKIMIVLLSLSVFVLTGCEEEQFEAPDLSDLPQFEAPDINEDLVSPLEYTHIEVLNIIDEAMSKQTNYIKYQSGTSVTTSGMSVNQEIKNYLITFEENKFLHSSSEGIVNMKHNALFSNEYIAYSHNSDEIVKDTFNNYEDTYGITSNTHFTGYIINEDTVVSSNLEQNGEKLVYTYILNNDTSSVYMKKQMKQFGGLTEEPVFENIELKLYIDTNWNIEKIDTKENYIAKKRILIIITSYLEQNLTTTFHKYNELNIDIQDYIDALEK